MKKNLPNSLIMLPPRILILTTTSTLLITILVSAIKILRVVV